MDDETRRKRPAPQRTAPIRDLRGIFGPPAAHAQQDEQVGEKAADARAVREVAAADGEEQSSSARHAPPKLETAIARSVEIGYRVIDDYIRQGQEVAQSLRDGRATTETLVRDAGDLGARLARYASDFVGAWLDLLELATSNASSGPAASGDGPPPSMSTPDDGANADAARRITLSVAACRPVEASLQFDRQPTGQIRVHALRSSDADLPRIDDVAVLDPGEDSPLTVRVRVSDDHPAGTYEGLVLDVSRNVPVGVVRVVISP